MGEPIAYSLVDTLHKQEEENFCCLLINPRDSGSYEKPSTVTYTTIIQLPQCHAIRLTETKRKYNNCARFIKKLKQ